jgi:hypothetical protein
LILTSAGEGLAAEGVGKPAKGTPYPEGPQTIPYEDVLDHCNLLLVGEVKRLTADSVEIKVAKVLKGKYEGEAATIGFKGRWAGSIQSMKKPEIGHSGAFMCLAKDGKLIIAGEPPKGGGFIEEGEKLAVKLLEAAKDPAKGFESKDPAVRLSSAYRLTRAWIKAPADAKPKLPAGVVKVLADGLTPDEMRGRHVSAVARNCINTIFACNINRLFGYSVNHDETSRDTTADAVKEAWERTVARVRKRRTDGGGNAKDPDRRDLAAKAADLVKKLGSEDYDVREGADRDLRKMGKLAMEAVRKGAASKDVEVAERCKAILTALERGDGSEMPADEKVFNLELAEPFVPAAAKPDAKAQE